VSDDLLRVEYEQTVDLLRTLTDVRFKLLAFVPTIAGTAVALLGHAGHSAQLLAVGSLGFTTSVGVLLYELRNTEVYEYALAHLEELERQLGLGLYTRRPHHRHDRPLAIVYAVVLGAWGYLVAWGALAAGGVGDAQLFGGLIGAAVALVSGTELERARWKEEPAKAAGPSAVTSSGS
jgi:hypothetical protein